jgi:hypothetical protein
VNPAPVTVACEIFTAPSPVFVKVTLCVALFPTARLPKLKLVTFGESTPAPGVCGVVFAVLVYAAQFESPTIATTIAKIVRKVCALVVRVTVAPSCVFAAEPRRAWL